MKKLPHINNNQKISKLTGLLVSFLLVSSFTSNAFAEYEKNSNVHATKIQYLVKSGPNSFYLQYKTCIGNDPVKTPTFVIKSDMESKVIKFDKILMPNSCKVFETMVKSKHANTISVKIINA